MNTKTKCQPLEFNVRYILVVVHILWLTPVTSSSPVGPIQRSSDVGLPQGQPREGV